MIRIQQFDFSIDPEKALLWRHNDAVNLQALIANKKTAINNLNDDFWNNWKQDVFDLRNANDFGLNVWSIILDIPLTIEVESDRPNNSSFGFGEFRKNFSGNFAPSQDGIILTTEQARLVLLLRYYQIIGRANLAEANAIVNDVFSSLGDVWVLDNLNMTIRYVFSFSLPAQLRQVIENYDILPRPTAVGVEVFQGSNKFFGFGSFRKNFNNAPFRKVI